MNKLDRLNELLGDQTLDLPDLRRKVDRQGSNFKWLQRNLAIRNSEHESYEEIDKLLRTRIGNLVNQSYEPLVV